MGMDIIGLNPSSETGQYFRNNVWWWRPLSFYIQENHPKIAKMSEDWDTNSGHGLNDKHAKLLAQRLYADIETGKVEEYQTKFELQKELVEDENCEYCKTTGIRHWPVTTDSGETTTELRAEQCNVCNGKGTVRPFITHYSFSIENVKAFIDFLTDCGGFAIY